MKTEDIKKMAQAWLSVQEASKKKMDPVDQDELKGTHAQRKDKDINNDGKVNKSDEYLHNRRKAVSAAIKGKSSKDTTKEVVTFESSESKLDSFLKGMKDGKLHAATKKRKPTQYVMKDKKDVQKEEVEELDELSKKTLGSYVKKASSDQANQAYKLGAGQEKDFTRAFKRKAGIEKATDKLTKEEVEQIDELKKSTLASYVKKAAGNMAGNAAVATTQASSSALRRASPEVKRNMVNRMKGIAKASDKLAKESVEQIDEISKEKAADYHAKSVQFQKDALRSNDPKKLKKIGNRLIGVDKANKIAGKVLGKESVEEAATHKPGVASPAGEGLSPSAKEQLAKKTPAPSDAFDANVVNKKTFDAMRASSKTAPKRSNDQTVGDKNIVK